MRAISDTASDFWGRGSDHSVVGHIFVGGINCSPKHIL